MHSLSAPEGSRSPVNQQGCVTSGGFRRTHFIGFLAPLEIFVSWLTVSSSIFVELAKVPWAEGESSSIPSALLVGDPLHGTYSVRRDSCDHSDLERQSGGGTKDQCSRSIEFSLRKSCFCAERSK